MPRTNPRTVAEYQRIRSRICGSLSRQDRAGLLAELGDRGKWDLHFFAAVIMGCTVMSPTDGIHGRVCSFLQSAEPARKWLEIFRGGLKSTLGTVASSVQVTVRDPVGSHQLLISAVHPLAKSFLRDIKAVHLSRTFRAVYPEIEPVKDQWTREEAAVTLRGQARESREPSYGTAGLDVGITGTHWTRVVYDDLVIPENVETAEMAKKVEQKFKGLRPLLDTWGTPELMCSTPYEPYDMYSWMKRSRAGWFQRLSIPAAGHDGVLAWPEEFPQARLDEYRALDLKMFYSQYLLDARPVAQQIFQAATIRYFRMPEDPAPLSWKAKTALDDPVTMDLRNLKLFLGWDPAVGSEGGDEAALAIIGIDEFYNFYVIDVVHGNYTEAEQMEWFFLLHKHYAPYGGIQMTALEQAGAFLSFGVTLKAEMDRRHEWYYVDKPQLWNQEKVRRIRNIVGPKYANGRIYHHYTLYNSSVEAQLLAFPGRHDDMVDAISHGIDFAQQHGGGGSVRPTEAAVRHQARSTFGRYNRIAFTTEELENGDDERYWEQALKEGPSIGLFG